MIGFTPFSFRAKHKLIPKWRFDSTRSISDSSEETFTLQLSLQLNILNFVSLKLIKYVTLVTLAGSLTLMGAFSPGLCFGRDDRRRPSTHVRV